MLTLPRSTTAARRLFLHARTLSAVPHNVGSPKAGAEQPSSSAAPDDEATENRQQQTHLANLSAECMYVYPWNGIRSSAEGLAIARAVQDKYGPAREVIFPRVRHASSIPRVFVPRLLILPNLRVSTTRTKTASTSSGRISGSCMTARTCAS